MLSAECLFLLRLSRALLRRRRCVRLLSRVLLGRQDRMQRIPFLAGAEFYNALAFYVFDQTLQNLAAKVGAGHFTSAEKNCGFDLVAFVQEAQHVILLGFVVVVIHVDTKLDFLDRDRLLVLFGLAFFFLLLVEKFPVVHDPAHRRNCGGRNLNQVQVLFAGHFERFVRGHYTNLFTFVPDDSNFTRSNTVVRADKAFIDTILRRL